MAAFASGRRSPAVRVLVLFLALCLAFCWCLAPHAYAISETIAVFGLASVLSAATAALGYKLSNSSQGKATLSQMCSDFAQDAVMGAKVLVGMKIYGLQEGMKYIKMQVKNGKTYLDSKVVAWCQQYLANQGVYNTSTIKSDLSAKTYTVTSSTFSSLSDAVASLDGLSFPSTAEFPFDASLFLELYNLAKADLPLSSYDLIYLNAFSSGNKTIYKITLYTKKTGVKELTLAASSASDYAYSSSPLDFKNSYFENAVSIHGQYTSDGFLPLNGDSYIYNAGYAGSYNFVNPVSYYGTGYYTKSRYGVSGSNFGLVGVSGNTTGLSGTDTLGKDYINMTLEQILAGLKDWAKDWYDAGVESVLDGATAGDIDLPLTVGAGAATLNPDVAADEELVYTPSFDLPLEDVRSGDTAASDVTAGLDNAASQTASADIAENQSVVDSLVSWLKDYFSVDKGMFSRFPLCVPYDAYLLVTSALGYDPPHSASDIFNNNPDTASQSLVSAQASSGWEPVIDLSSDMHINGQTVPLDLKLDLTLIDDLMSSTVRPMVTIYLLGCLIGAEFWRLNHDGK